MRVPPPLAEVTSLTILNIHNISPPPPPQPGPAGPAAAARRCEPPRCPPPQYSMGPGPDPPHLPAQSLPARPQPEHRDSKPGVRFPRHLRWKSPGKREVLGRILRFQRPPPPPLIPGICGTGQDPRPLRTSEAFPQFLRVLTTRKRGEKEGLRASVFPRSRAGSAEGRDLD